MIVCDAASVLPAEQCPGLEFLWAAAVVAVVVVVVVAAAEGGKSNREVESIVVWLSYDQGSVFIWKRA